MSHMSDTQTGMQAVKDVIEEGEKSVKDTLTGLKAIVDEQVVHVTQVNHLTFAIVILALLILLSLACMHV